MQKARMLIVLLLIFQFQQFQPGQSEKVPCPDQQEACDCPVNFTTCEFELQIEELQTFTSYAKDQDGDLLIRGTPGTVYYIDRLGYHPSVPSTSSSPERRGQCYLGSLSNDEDFTSRNCSIPMTVDGVSYRKYIAVNGRIPGPTLIVTEDKLVKVRVYNRLTSEGITIHWHGMHQRNKPWMDGVGFISQYPIGPGAFFDYVFRATPAGTHWYHSHVGAQRTDGLFGGLVVREKDNRFRNIIEPLIKPDDIARGDNIIDLPENHTLTLLDWQREASLDLFVKIHSTLGFYRMTNLGDVPNSTSVLSGRSRSADGVEVGPVPYWSGLINGRGRMDGQLNLYTPLSEFTVTHESIYRFRVIGAQSLYAYKFSIDQHILRVIATDGHFITPVDVDFIIVHSGERYDFLVDTNNISPNNYWIRAQTLDQIRGNRNTAFAVLRYSSVPPSLWINGYSGVRSSSRPCTAQKNCVVLNCPFRNFTENIYTSCIHLTDLTPLMPLSNENLPEFTTTTDNVKFFNFGFEGESTTSAVSGRNFQLPITPYQTNCGQLARDQRDTNDNVDTCNKCMRESSSTDCKCTYVEKIAENDNFRSGQVPTIMMVFRATTAFSHPIHLHGHSFHIVHIEHGNYSSNGILQGNSPDIDCREDLMCRDPRWKGGVTPMAVMNKAGTNGRIRNTAIQKDTVIVPAGGYVVVVFKADNPGYWFLHCHIEVHQLEGMGVLIEEYPYTQHSCPPNKIEKHGNFEWTIEDYNNHKGTCSAYAIKPLSILTLIYIMATAVLYPN